LIGAKVRFSHSANPKLNSDGVVPNLSSAEVSSFAVNVR
jgi:hypothetical protein